MDYEKFIAAFNEKDNFSITNGIRLDQMGEGYAKVCGRVDGEQVKNFMGGPHGGFLFTLADVAAGNAILSYGKHCVTLNASINFIKSPKGGEISAVAQVLHHGRSTGVCDVELLDDKGRLIAKGVYTMFITGTPVQEMTE